MVGGSRKLTIMVTIQIPTHLLGMNLKLWAPFYLYTFSVLRQNIRSGAKRTSYIWIKLIRKHETKRFLQNFLIISCSRLRNSSNYIASTLGQSVIWKNVKNKNPLKGTKTITITFSVSLRNQFMIHRFASEEGNVAFFD